MNIFSLLQSSADRFGKRPAIYRGRKTVATYSELHDNALRLANNIGDHSKAGDRILILSSNCPEYIEILLAIWAAGGVAVPVNYKLHAREVLHIIEDARPTRIFASATLAKDLETASPEPIDCKITIIGGPEYHHCLTGEPAIPADTAPDDLAWLFYTSGTTGRSKGAMLSHRNLMAMHIAHLADFEDIASDHNLVHAAPLSHASGLYLIPYLARGAGHIISEQDHFDPDEILQICRDRQGCGMFLAPTMVNRLRDAAEKSGAVPTGLRTILYGGAPMYLADLKKAQAALGPVFIQLYGQGEAPLTITGLRRSDHDTDDDHILASVGWARSGVAIKIVDDTGHELPRGQSGEIICRGDVVMQGYWNDPQASASALRSDWLWTGDRGMMDPNGMVTLQDRSKDVIISGGSNVYPREVEEVLLQHPAVMEVCVLGQQDAEWGEIVVAFIVGTNQVSSEALDAHCLEHIARFKRPKKYHFIRELPKSAYGKVLKRELAMRV